MAYSKEQNKLTEIIHEEVMVSVLPDKDFKLADINVFKILKETIL